MTATFLRRPLFFRRFEKQPALLVRTNGGVVLNDTHTHTHTHTKHTQARTNGGLVVKLIKWKAKVCVLRNRMRGFSV